MLDIDYLNIWSQMGVISKTLAFIFLFGFVLNTVRISLNWTRGFSVIAIISASGIFFSLIYTAIIFELKLLFIAPLVLALMLIMSHIAKLGVNYYYSEEMDETVFSMRVCQESEPE